MTYCSRLSVGGLVATLLACAGRTQIRHVPREVKDVADSVRVRATFTDGRPRVNGRAFNWRSGVPNIVTTTGDTITPAPEATLEVLTKRRGHMIEGAIAGYFAALTIDALRCWPDLPRCREREPILVLGTLVGAFIGAKFRNERWATVSHATGAASSRHP